MTKNFLGKKIKNLFLRGQKFGLRNREIFFPLLVSEEEMKLNPRGYGKDIGEKIYHIIKKNKLYIFKLREAPTPFTRLLYGSKNAQRSLFFNALRYILYESITGVSQRSFAEHSFWEENGKI